MKNTFESFLQSYHCDTHPEILDDELPDAYNDWLGDLSVDEWIELGEKWGKEMKKEVIGIRI